MIVVGRPTGRLDGGSFLKVNSPMADGDGVRCTERIRSYRLVSVRIRSSRNRLFPFVSPPPPERRHR